MIRSCLTAVALLASSPGLGQVLPQTTGGDPRVQAIDYHEQQVVTIQAAPGYQVTIMFAPDERIENVALGDSGAWQATPNRRGDYLFLKPVQGGVATNMTVMTDTRVYAFDLRPLPGPQPDMAYTVRFRYPGATGTDAQEAAAAGTPDAASPGRYKVTGARAIRPVGIDDDGAKTFIEWPPSTTLPAVYSIDANGKEALVNGYMRDDIYVIDSVAAQLVFRLDRQVARATRIEPR
jgi:type IV secretion system protein VirB9